MPYYSKTVALSTTASSVLDGDRRRESIIFTNLDTAINVDIGTQEELRDSAGIRLFPQQTLVLSKNDRDDPTIPWSAVGASGTPDLRIAEGYPIEQYPGQYARKL